MIQPERVYLLLSMEIFIFVIVIIAIFDGDLSHVHLININGILCIKYLIQVKVVTDSVFSFSPYVSFLMADFTSSVLNILFFLFMLLLSITLFSLFVFNLYSV